METEVISHTSVASATSTACGDAGGIAAAMAAMPQPPLLARLWAHFGQDPGKLPVLEQEFAKYERPNLHIAIEELLSPPGCDPELIGVVLAEEYQSVTLAKMSRPASSISIDEGPVEYVDVPLSGERTLACVKRGLYLFRHEGRPAAMLVTQPVHSHPPRISAAVMAADREQAEQVVRRLTRLARVGKAYRGHVLSIQSDCYGDLRVHFHRLAHVGRDGIILPEALMRRIERHTTSFSRNAGRLKAAGRHLKRGILLHGPPGTGKTLSAMYLAGQMPGRTVLLLTGHGMGSIETACGLARLLEPSTVILEDVDLIGTVREEQTVGANALLFELLNQMDGLADDADVLFILTTNRPEILEPALASRPGRIDQAIHVPLPDADCRRRLLDLYARGLDLRLSDPDNLVRRTEGVSGAFIREVLRKAAVLSAEEAGDAGGDSSSDEKATDTATLVVTDRHIDEALGELLLAGGPLTRTLLGAAPAAPTES
jgi:cell division protease FtsH